MIESVQNEKVKSWVRLQTKKGRDETGLFFVQSIHLVEEAIKKNMAVELIVKEGFSFPSSIKTTVVSTAVMKKLSTQVTCPTICAVCKKLEEKPITGDVLALDGISDPGNLGTIIRSAVAFGIPNLLLSETCVDLYNPKVLHSGEGMIFHMNIVRKPFVATLTNLVNTHELYGTDVRTGKTSFSKAKKPIVLIIGNEGHGMSNEAKALCTSMIHIPMQKECESLNAAVSASILMYELQRGRI